MTEKIAVLTGAAGGVGSATVKLLDEKGYRLALVDINRNGLETLAKTLSREPLIIVADLSLASEPARIRAEVIGKFGGLDVFINNAGVGSTERYENRPMEDIEREMDINYTAASRLIREFIPYMKEKGSGSIVAVCSLAGILPLKESPVYVASKFALRGLMIALHLALKDDGIKVTNVCPTAIDTPLLLEETEGGGSALNFLGDPLKPSDVARAILEGIRTGVVEICVPWSEGIGCKILGFAPSLISIVAPPLEKLAKKRQMNYLAEKRRIADGK